MALVPVIKDNDWVSVRQAITALSTLRMGPNAHPVYGGLTLTGLNGVLKASSGVVFGSATLDDLGEGTTYKRLTSVQVIDLTDGGETTLHTHPASGITEIDWGDIGGTLSDQTDLQGALDDKAPVNDILANIVFGSLTLNNTGLRLMDTNASHYLNIRCTSDLTANRLLKFTTGDYDRTIVFSGTGPSSTTLGDWFNQSVKIAATPTFTGLVLKGSVTVDVNGVYDLGTSSKRFGDIYVGKITSDEIVVDEDTIADDVGDLHIRSSEDVYILAGQYDEIHLQAGGNTTNYIRISTATNQTTLSFVSQDGRITADGGNISFDNENLITSGAITGGAITGTTLFATAADGLTLGTDAATNIAGKIKFWSAGAVNWSTTLTAGVQTADANYTLPLARPTANSQALLGTNADPSVLSWGTDFGANNLLTSGDVKAGSFTIGANVLDTTEWAFLDGQDQAVKTTNTPQFARLGIGTPAAAGYGIAVAVTSAESINVGVYGSVTSTKIGFSAGNTYGLNFFAKWNPVSLTANSTSATMIGAASIVQSIMPNDADAKTMTITKASGFEPLGLFLDNGTSPTKGLLKATAYASFRAINQSLISLANGAQLTEQWAFYDPGMTAGATNWGLAINTQSYINGNLRVGSAVAPSAALDFADAKDIAFGTTTGTKIGTAANQKIGFFNAVPVVQQTKAGHNNWASLSDVVNALVSLGLLDIA